MAFDINKILQNPQFQSGLGLVGLGAGNRPMIEAYNMLQQMQQQQLEQQKMKQYLELQQAQEKRLEEQSKLYGRQVATAEEKAKREAAMGKLFEQMLPGLMGGQQPPAAPQMPIPPQPAQPAMPEMEPLAPSSQFFRSRLVPIESGGKQFDPKTGIPLLGPVIPGRSERAVGIAQVMPTTGPEAAKLAGVPWDVRRFHQDEGYNLQLGEAYFQKQLQDFKSLDKAAAAYNAGPGRLKEAIARATLAGNPATWLNYMPQETQAYVNKALEGKTGLATPTLPNEAPQQPVVPVVDNRYRDLQRASAAFKGMGGDYAGALEGFAKASEPKTYTAGTYVDTPQGLSRIPNPEEQERLRNDAERLRNEKERLRLEQERTKAEVKLTEAEGKSTAYFSQMTDARSTLENLATAGWNPNSMLSQIGTSMAGGLTNPLATDMQQRAKQAQEQWAEAYLRFKTGAATNADEVARNVRTFFPQFGDSENVIKQKEKARKDAEKAVEISAGRGAAKLPPREAGSQPASSGPVLSLDDYIKSKRGR